MLGLCTESTLLIGQRGGTPEVDVTTTKASVVKRSVHTSSSESDICSTEIVLTMTLSLSESLSDKWTVLCQKRTVGCHSINITHCSHLRNVVNTRKTLSPRYECSGSFPCRTVAFVTHQTVF